MSSAGCQIKPIDVNFHLKKSLEVFNKNLADKFWSKSHEVVHISPLKPIRVKPPLFYQVNWYEFENQFFSKDLLFTSMIFVIFAHHFRNLSKSIHYLILFQPMSAHGTPKLGRKISSRPMSQCSTDSNFSSISGIIYGHHVSHQPQNHHKNHQNHQINHQSPHR